jgi:hypothetical protein
MENPTPHACNGTTVNRQTLIQMYPALAGLGELLVARLDIVTA